MRRYFFISAATIVIAALFYFAVDALSGSTGAAIGSLTLTGLTSLVVFSAYNARELRKGS